VWDVLCEEHVCDSLASWFRGIELLFLLDREWIVYVDNPNSRDYSLLNPLRLFVVGRNYRDSITFAHSLAEVIRPPWHQESF
jgi:hypothetical protein